jgi:hypothetical protein
VDEVLALSQSAENVRCQRNRNALLARDESYVPAVMPLLNKLYVAESVGINLRDIRRDPELNVRLELISKILNFERFAGDTPLVPELLIYLGVSFEPELCGIPSREMDGHEPWIGEPILGSAAAAAGLTVPSPTDLRSTAIMQTAVRLYEGAQDLVGDLMPVHMQGWYAGHLRVVQKLRGEACFFADLYDDPQAVHRMFGYVDQVRQQYDRVRCDLVGDVPCHAASTYWDFQALANDEVSGHLISAQHYEEFIYPYDLAFCKDYPRVYYHGDGKFTPFLPLIKTLPNVEMIEVGRHTDLAQAAQVLGDKVAFDVTFSEVDREFTGSGELQQELLDRIVTAAGDSFFHIVLFVNACGGEADADVKNFIDASRQAIERHWDRRREQP